MKDNRKEALNNMTIKELRAEAKAMSIEGISRVKKEKLIEAILNAADSEPAFTATVSKVHMYAFTGMYIGEFDIVDEGENIIINTSSKGELIFDGKTGKEITSKAKARYANRIERV